MTTRAINEKCLLAHLKAEHQHDMAGTLATLHPECLFEDRPIGMTLRGREGARQHYQLWWSAFGVSTEEGAVHWVRDDLAIGEAYFAGEHKGTFLGIPASGLPIRFPFTVICNFRDGFLAGERSNYDLNDILRQIGQPSFKLPVAA